MAEQSAQQIDYYDAAEDLSKGEAVKFTNTNEVTKVTSDTDVVAGIVKEDAKSGETVSIISSGPAKSLLDGSSGATLSPGDRLMPSTTNNGHLESHTGNADESYVGEYRKSQVSGSGSSGDDVTSDGELALINLFDDRHRSS